MEGVLEACAGDIAELRPEWNPDDCHFACTLGRKGEPGTCQPHRYDDKNKKNTFVRVKPLVFVKTGW